MYGGYNYNFGGDLNDMWEYDGTDWRQINYIGNGPCRSNASMVYDRHRKKIVLFEGGDWYDLKNDTWEFDFESNKWTKINTPSSPSPRNQCGMVYDTYKRKVVLFSGYGEYGYKPTDTWEYDGNNWQRIYTEHSPSGRNGPGIVFDTIRNRIILFGGYSYPNEPIEVGYKNDLWEYDGDDWHEIKVEDSPPGRLYPGMAYDFHRDRIVIYGGHGKSDFLEDTWELLLPSLLKANLDIEPDTINLKSKGKWITAYIELPEGFNVREINISTVSISAIDRTAIDDPIYAELLPTEIGDIDGDGIPDLKIKFSREALIKYLIVGKRTITTVSYTHLTLPTKA